MIAPPSKRSSSKCGQCHKATILAMLSNSIAKRRVYSIVGNPGISELPTESLSPTVSATGPAMFAASPAVSAASTAAGFAISACSPAPAPAAHGIIHADRRIYTAGPARVGITVRQGRRGGGITRVSSSSSSVHVLFRVSKNSDISFGHAYRTGILAAHQAPSFSSRGRS